jgi:glucokinase
MSSILCADVGGTNTRVALCDPQTLRPATVKRFRNAEFDSLSSVLRHYLEDKPDPSLIAACVAVAGPVRHGRGRLTNLDWEMDAAMLCAATGAPRGFVINDLEAQGYALPHVDTRCFFGTQDPGETSPRLVVGMGTGFNAAPVHGVPGRGMHVVPSECGHISLPVWNDDSYAVSRELRDSHDFASIEEVLSGRGLLALHRHYARTHGAPLDSTTEIIRAIAERQADTDRHTADMVCGMLGRVLGDLALVHLPWGGIYLIGGLARAVEPFLAGHGFAEGFLDKGRFRSFLEDFSVFIVEDDFAALTGCAEYAVQGVAAEGT